MRAYLNCLQEFITSEDGPTAVEYAVVVALIIISCMAAITVFQTALAGWFTDTSTTVSGLPTS